MCAGIAGRPRVFKWEGENETHQDSKGLQHLDGPVGQNVAGRFGEWRAEPGVAIEGAGVFAVYCIGSVGNVSVRVVDVAAGYGQGER